MTKVKKWYEFVWDGEMGRIWDDLGKKSIIIIYVIEKSIFNNEECNIDNESLGAR